MTVSSADSIAIVVAILVSIIAPTLLSILNGRQLRRAKIDDWARQDLVAAKAAEAAESLQEAQQETIRRTNEVAKIAAASDFEIKKQLTAVHHLVDGDLTAARQAELDQTRITLVLLKRVIALDELRGLPPNKDDADTLAVRENRIEDLENIIAERHAQMAVEQGERLSEPPV